jgi:DNA-binding FrmR family transcriptional regulator
MDQESQKSVKVRLARIEGQVRGLSQMIEHERDSAEVLTQLAALRAALDSVGSILITDHIEEMTGAAVLTTQTRQSLKSMIEIFLK